MAGSFFVYRMENPEFEWEDEKALAYPFVLHHHPFSSFTQIAKAEDRVFALDYLAFC